MSLFYDVLRCLSNCFKFLRIFYIILHLPYLISVFFEIFKKTNSILCLKLFIFHILDQMLDQIITTLAQYFFFFQKYFSTFFPFGIVLFGFFFLKEKWLQYFIFSFNFYFIKEPRVQFQRGKSRIFFFFKRGSIMLMLS